MGGPCSSCGPFTQYCSHQSNSFSSMFWSPQCPNSTYDDDADNYIYSSSSSSSSSPSVDCTLSLGTPSTRLTSPTQINNNTIYDQPPKQHTPHRNSVSSFCWDLLHPSTKQHNQPSSKPPRSSINSAASDSLLARRCANCDTTSTPLWRNGPRGPKSLCNACGIRFKKEERRAAAATNTAGAHNNATAVAGYVDPSNGCYNGSWTSNPYATSTPQKMQSFGGPNEFRFIEDDQRGSEPGIQFLSWLTHDRPSGLVHDFTR